MHMVGVLSIEKNFQLQINSWRHTWSDRQCHDSCL